MSYLKGVYHVEPNKDKEEFHLDAENAVENALYNSKMR
jgi:hypothetical protein